MKGMPSLETRAQTLAHERTLRTRAAQMGTFASHAPRVRLRSGDEYPGSFFRFDRQRRACDNEHEANCAFRILRAYEPKTANALVETFEPREHKAFGPHQRIRFNSDCGQRMVAIVVADERIYFFRESAERTEQVKDAFDAKPRKETRRAPMLSVDAEDTLRRYLVDGSDAINKAEHFSLARELGHWSAVTNGDRPNRHLGFEVLSAVADAFDDHAEGAPLWKEHPFLPLYEELLGTSAPEPEQPFRHVGAEKDEPDIHVGFVPTARTPADGFHVHITNVREAASPAELKTRYRAGAKELHSDVTKAAPSTPAEAKASERRRLAWDDLQVAHACKRVQFADGVTGPDKRTAVKAEPHLWPLVNGRAVDPWEFIRPGDPDVE